MQCRGVEGRTSTFARAVLSHLPTSNGRAQGLPQAEGGSVSAQAHSVLPSLPALVRPALGRAHQEGQPGRGVSQSLTRKAGTTSSRPPRRNYVTKVTTAMPTRTVAVRSTVSRERSDLGDERYASSISPPLSAVSQRRASSGSKGSSSLRSAHLLLGLCVDAVGVRRGPSSRPDVVSRASGGSRARILASCALRRGFEARAIRCHRESARPSCLRFSAHSDRRFLMAVPLSVGGTE